MLRSHAVLDGEDIDIIDPFDPSLSGINDNLPYMPLFLPGTSEEKMAQRIMQGNLPETGYIMNP